jgi:hypothetical protein
MITVVTSTGPYLFVFALLVLAIVATLLACYFFL